ncbi:MAG: type II and III secretion system protein family protein [Hyphomicrobiaceae bacterium]
MKAKLRNTWAAAMIAVAGLFGTATLVDHVTPAHAASSDPDVAHNGVLRIGYDEPLPAHRNVLVGLSKTMMVELPRDLRDVVVSNPEFLDAVVQTSNRVYLIAKKLGDANVFFFDENGEQILTLEVRIERDMAVFDRLIERLIPGASVEAEVINDTIILTGSVPNPADSARAAEIAARFMTRPGDSNTRYTDKVINMLRVEAKEQVMLKVTVAEVERNTIKRLGVNWNGVHLGDSAFGLTTNNGFPVSGGDGANAVSFGIVGPTSNLASCLGSPQTAVTLAAGASLNCLARSVEVFERTGLMKTLAEPTLTAISGETASFLAGGEFPIPVAQDNGSISVEWKPFGVGLSFTPLVMTEGLISLKLNTEVSELSNDGAVSLGGGLAISGLKVRRASTTVELPSGGSLVIAGLINDDTRQNIEGLPGLKSLPILGTLFRSRDFQKSETELVVIVTPYTVNAVATSALAKPTDGLHNASDVAADFLGEMNKVYGRGDALPRGRYEGNYGFIVE